MTPADLQPMKALSHNQQFPQQPKELFITKQAQLTNATALHRDRLARSAIKRGLNQISTRKHTKENVMKDTIELSSLIPSNRNPSRYAFWRRWFLFMTAGL